MTISWWRFWKNAAKWGALYGSDLFVLPSHQENFGIAIVEAMACKTPVLITNRVNIWREIAEGKGGIVTDDNLQSVTEGLQKWLAMDAATQSAMGDNAYESYMASFTAEATSRKFVEVIKGRFGKMGIAKTLKRIMQRELDTDKRVVQGVSNYNIQ